MGNSLPVIICDDSPLARKHMERALAPWNLSITHANHGLEALEAIRAGKGELLFLDLNMPLMDGYEVLERIREQDLPVLTIVVSGDIQPEAHERVRQLGALDFIRKPIDIEHLSRSLHAFGLLEEIRPVQNLSPGVSGRLNTAPSSPIEQAQALSGHYQELANVAMGQAAALLAQLMNTFIELPIPSVKLVESGELEMAMQQSISQSAFTTVCQGFIAPGISGEALLILNGTQAEQLAQLLNHQGEVTEQVERELTMEIATLLIGAFLNGFGQQLDLNFSQSSPKMLDTLPRRDSLMDSNQPDRILSIEISYRIEGLALSCDLLLLFTEDSLPPLNELASHLL
ncbi:response regulator [Marinobacterium sediminicola]|uniref:DNA-binding transcriptional response regulator, NtrC family, contains REC, AAA-type ATPase, and a Fis-type DNA-binding domains n=1 Tax=Marinobacterium sediminicola TaxID=518898 RepID=A0ABY1RWR4_9GAMM|nr:response regulator [Marinobacterium sediminicola]ULG70304.1 response regulator [Marinobacterium sediminicola]SMR69792.1 DNA-binding transcriptional response regulator, NtrC family, contains REC, AAA-type ATPase, and a Fis-type DNA-binding domains [Marinobacterium sediminicola]